MRMLSLCFALLVACLPARAAETVSFTETVRIEGQEFRIPMTARLRALSDETLRIVVRGDLGQIQDNLPALLSRRLESDCEADSALAVTEVSITGAVIRIAGQLQTRRYLCLGGGENRAELLRQTANVAVRLSGSLEEGCLVMQVIGVDLAPDGITGALMDVSGLTDRLRGQLEARLDEAFTSEENCLRIPEEFEAFDTRIIGGGFREREDGRLGALIRGEMTVTSENLIRLIALLGRKGRIGD